MPEKVKNIMLTFGPRDQQTYKQVLDWFDNLEGSKATAIKKILLDHVSSFNNPQPKKSRTRKKEQEIQPPEIKTKATRKKKTAEQPIQKPERSTPEIVDDDEDMLLDEEEIIKAEAFAAKDNKQADEATDNIHKGLDFLGLDNIKL